MSLASNLQTAFTRVATEFKAIRTLIGGSGTATIASLTTTDKTSLVGAINEVNAKPSGGGSLASLSDAAITTPATGHLIRYNATTSKWENVLGTTYFEVAGAAAAAQAASQPLDSDLTAIAALTTTAYGRAFLSLADQAAFMGLVPAASDTVAGKVEISTAAENTTGTDDTRAVSPLGLQTRLAAYAQPLDSDLTNIAALTTTAYGRALLTLADQAALMGLVPAASETVSGKVELATNAETITGSDTTRAAHPAGVKATIDARIINDSTLAGNSTVNAPSVASVKAYADGLLDANNAFTYKGVIDASANPNYPAASAGHVYKISVAGRIGGASGAVVEVGDTVTALVDGSAAGTHATVGANWIITQTNIDGAVIGPASSVAGNLVTFSGATGKVVADSGFAASNAALSNSAVLVPTQAQVQAWAQQKDATLTALAGLTTAANQVILATGVDTFSMLATGATGRALLQDGTALEARTEIDVYSKAEVGDPNTDFVATFNAGLL